MGHLSSKTNECNYKKNERGKYQFINRINDEIVTKEIIKEVTTIRETSDITSEQVLHWAKRLEAWRPRSNSTCIQENSLTP